MDSQLARLPSAESPESAAVPLVVDLDGTLIGTDLLLESFVGVAGRSPATAFKSLLWLVRGKAVLKRRLAEAFAFDPEHLPYNRAVLDLVGAARAQGRQTCLASASDALLVERIAEHLGVFDRWMASDGSANLKGERKAARLIEAFGERGFDYVGNEAADLAVWNRADAAIVVGASAVRGFRAGQAIKRVAAKPRRPWAWLKLLRPHQWSKNALVFVAVLTSHLFTVHTLLAAALAFVAFSLCASSVYVINDLVDIQADRAHPTKRRRPFASGDVAILQGALLGLAVFLGAVTIAWFVEPMFLGMLMLYFVTNLLYSFSFKRKMMIDVVTLAGLYTVRVLAGAVAIGVPISEWLLAFSMFLFLFLALIKRHSEMIMRFNAGMSDPTNRNYKAADISVLVGLAAAAGYSSVIVFALYIASDAARHLYNHVQFLWFVCPLLLYWIARTIVMSQRQHISDDPVVFAMRDKVTWSVALLIVALGAAAAF